MADLPDWSEKLFFGAGSARSHARNASDFMGSSELPTVRTVSAPSGGIVPQRNASLWSKLLIHENLTKRDFAIRLGRHHSSQCRPLALSSTNSDLPIGAQSCSSIHGQQQIYPLRGKVQMAPAVSGRSLAEPAGMLSGAPLTDSHPLI